ncbi:FAD:protein FMN transferase [uncultured Oscillibacter sp.]|uniref:FAD:protein FMN transferase n=1 Tax=uncultured Oscillibacter sp. TaxID=876091 RepID=UPI002620F83C|nr:FAD:protein FMN transferase [uncultured Oscillibacter sp.]
MRRLAIYVSLLLLLLPGCGAPVDPDEAQESIQVLAMDTAMLITTYGERSPAAAYACEDTIRDLEAKLSRTDPDSEVSRLNSAGGEAVEVSEDLGILLELAKYYRRSTGDAFNIAIAPVVSAWGFAGGEEYRVPSQEELDGLLELAQDGPIYQGPQSHGGAARYSLGPGQAIDLGGLAKGYAADKILGVLQEYEVPRANISLGGNVLAYGGRPDGTPWRVGIQDPARVGEPNAFAGVLELTDSFAVTSGGYQRYFEENGKTYHHIIDPATGYPADSGLTSVTVVAGLGEGDGSGFPGAMCDAYSTALFVMGEERALDFWRDETMWGGQGCPFDLVLITEDGRVAVTEGLADRFTLDESGGYAYEVVS